MEIHGGNRPFRYAFEEVAVLTEPLEGWKVRKVSGMSSSLCRRISNGYPKRIYRSDIPMQLLKDKFPQIIDAVEPGGSGNLYAGLNNEEKSALQEATRMGFPPKSWYEYKDMGIHGFLVLIKVWSRLTESISQMIFGMFPAILVPIHLHLC